MRVKVMKYALGRYNEVERLEEVYRSEVYYIDREKNEILLYNKQQERFEWVSIPSNCKVELDESKPKGMAEMEGSR